MLFMLLLRLYYTLRTSAAFFNVFSCLSLRQNRQYIRPQDVQLKILLVVRTTTNEEAAFFALLSSVSRHQPQAERMSTSIGYTCFAGWWRLSSTDMSIYWKGINYTNTTEYWCSIAFLVSVSSL